MSDIQGNSAKESGKFTHVHINKGRQSYFCNEETNVSSWFLPVGDVEKLILAYESRNDHRPSETALDITGNGSESKALEEEDVYLEECVEQEDNEESARWVVKLHLDSGQTYFVDAMSDLATWRNPFDADQANEGFETVNLEAEAKKPPVEEAEKLAGFEDVPNRDVFFTDYVLCTQNRLQTWMDRNRLSVPDEYGAMLSYPEYLTMTADFPRDAFITVSLRLPKGLSEDSAGDMISSITTKQTLSDSVGKMMEGLFKKFLIRNGRALDEKGMDGYVFKLIGFQEYLLHQDFLLGHYDCAVNASRTKSKLDLLLVKLMPAELMDMDLIISRGVQDYIDSEKSSHSPNGDDWTSDERALVTQDAVDTDDYYLCKIYKSSINWPLRVLIQGISYCPREILCDFLQVEVNVFFNDESLLPSPCMTSLVPFSSNPRFPQVWIDTRLEVATLPATARIAFTLVGSSRAVPGQMPSTKTIIAGVCVTLVDYRRHLVTGEKILNMFPHQNLQVAMDPVKFKHEAIPDILNLACCVPGGNGECSAGALHVVFDSYSVPVIAETATLNSVIEKFPPLSSGGDIIDPPAEVKKVLDKVEKQDPLYNLTHTDKAMLWKYRGYCSKFPKLLPKFLQAVNWSVPGHAEEAHKIMVFWARISPTDALGLLDIRYSDPVVREYGIRIVDALQDAQFQELLLQLVQVLKYEAFHDSPLARLLLRRALRSPLKIGHHLFWMLRSEMQCVGVLERFGTLLFLYVQNCGPHEVSLRKQCFINDKIKVIADQIKTIPSKDRRVDAARAELELLDGNLPSTFCVCLTPRIECCAIKFKKCKVMDSKKLPLWIVFENADPYGKDFYTIFKSGDDLRQDQITLQLLRIMDLIWRGNYDASSEESPLDLQLKPYKCCSTGKDLGMIEVVVNSDTTANIMTGYGGKLTGAFSSTPIDAYLRENNQHGLYPTAVENFVRTCAGYCVATYVLGIGDRHAGNIMVAQSGHLFHIDFGHFLGNFKKKYGFSRERAPFVFTPEMAYVMRDTKFQGATYLDFERMCCQAYNMLRRRADLFINLFVLMVPAAMPELLEKSDIGYLRDMLSLELTPDQANTKFTAEIKNSLNTVSRRIDNWFHTLKH